MFDKTRSINQVFTKEGSAWNLHRQQVTPANVYDVDRQGQTLPYDIINEERRQQRGNAVRQREGPPTSNPVTGDMPSLSSTRLPIRRRAMSSSRPPAVVLFHAAAKSRAEKFTQWEDACPQTTTTSRAHSLASRIRPFSFASSPATGTSAAKQLVVVIPYGKTKEEHRKWKRVRVVWDLGY